MNDPKDRYPSQEIQPDVDLDTAPDFGSDLDDVIDIDQDFDAEEESIFEPKENKRKSTSKTLLVVLLILVLAGGGGYYYLTSTGDAPSNAPVPVAQSEAVPAVPPEEGVAQVQPDALQAVPQPVSDFETETPAVKDVPPDTSVTTPVETALNEIPEVPISEETPHVVAETAVPEADKPEDSSLPEVPTVPAANYPSSQAPVSALDGPLTPEPVTDTQTAPDQTALATPVQTAPQINPPVSTNSTGDLQAARQTINLNVDKKGGLVQEEYFDSPKGKSLKNFAPPPSINPFGEPGENIIIVRKGPNEEVVVAKGEDSGFVESKLVSANRAMSLGKYDAALGFYNELRKRNQRDPRILMGRAVTLQKLGENEQAIDAYNELLSVDPQNPEAITNLMGLVSKTQPARALQNLLELREKYPRNPAVAAQLGVAYAQSGNPQDGIRYLAMASKLQPENPLHFFNMAVLAEQMNNTSEAIKLYEQALDTSSIYPEYAAKAGFSRDQVYDRLSRLRVK